MCRGAVFHYVWPLCAMIGFAIAAEAQETTRPGAQSSDEPNIRQATEDYVAAFNRGDFEAMRSMWTQDGDYVDGQGRTQSAHDMLDAAEAAAESSGAGAQLSARPGKIRIVAPNVAIEDGAAETIGTDDDGSLVVGRYTAVWVKRDGRWLLDALRESTAETLSPAERMRDLEWMTGEWIGRTDDATIIVSARYKEDGAFLVREFAVTTHDGRTLTGEQRIGWDEAEGRFKVWLFGSQGTFGDGFLTREGAGWRLATKETLPDGQSVTVTSDYALGSNGELVWESSGPVIDGEQTPAVRAVFKRAADDSASVPSRLRPALPRIRRDAREGR